MNPKKKEPHALLSTKETQVPKARFREILTKWLLSTQKQARVGGWEVKQWRKQQQNVLPQPARPDYTYRADPQRCVRKHFLLLSFLSQQKIILNIFVDSINTSLTIQIIQIIKTGLCRIFNINSQCGEMRLTKQGSISRFKFRIVNTINGEDQC